MRYKPIKINLSPQHKSWRIVYTDLGKIIFSGETSGITHTKHNMIIADTEREAMRMYKWKMLIKNILGVMEK